MKTAISLPDVLFDQAEKLAVRLGLSRSQLYARALESFVERHDGKSITEKLNEIYASENAELDPVLYELQFKSLPEEDW